MLQADVIGNLGFDATVKQIGGKDYVSFDVAHEVRNGEQKETVWVSILWYGNGGKMMTYLKKGAKVFVRGRLTAKTYTTRQGEIKVSLSVLASEVQLCGFNESTEQTRPQSPAQPTAPATPAANALVDDDDSDMPEFLR